MLTDLRTGQMQVDIVPFCTLLLMHRSVTETPPKPTLTELSLLLYNGCTMRHSTYTPQVSRFPNDGH